MPIYLDHEVRTPARQQELSLLDLENDHSRLLRVSSRRPRQPHDLPVQIPLGLAEIFYDIPLLPSPPDICIRSAEIVSHVLDDVDAFNPTWVLSVVRGVNWVLRRRFWRNSLIVPGLRRSALAMILIAIPSWKADTANPFSRSVMCFLDEPRKLFVDLVDIEWLTHDWLYLGVFGHLGSLEEREGPGLAPPQE